MSAKTYLFTGRPCAGKTTIVEKMIKNGSSKYAGDKVVAFDGDVLRKGLCSDLGFSLEDRKENLRRIAEVSKLFNYYDKDVLASFVSPTNEIRDNFGKIVGPENFRLVYVRCSLEECERRDVKGMYKLAREGKIESFTGLHDDAPFEEPENPDLILDTEKMILEECIDSFYKKFILY